MVVHIVTLELLSLMVDPADQRVVLVPPAEQEELVL
jgi:hypothetical protein